MLSGVFLLFFTLALFLGYVQLNLNAPKERVFFRAFLF